jgi:uncharacterized protein YndB with AHSA1/START domain
MSADGDGTAGAEAGGVAGRAAAADGSVSVTRDIAAPPDKVWSMVSELSRMGEWSPENTGGQWVKGADGPGVGARFKGTNANGKRSWNTNIVVTECDQGRRFTFDVSSYGFGVATWSYGIEASPAGCTVTETWTDRRGWIVKTAGSSISGVKDRADFNRSSMEQTLANLAAAAEG